LLSALLCGAILDVVSSAQEKDQRVQESELRGQLAQFLLSIREPDGSSLLDNPAEFSPASRPLSVVTLRRSFFTYLLQTGNARSFKAGDISFEPPRACLVEFQRVKKSADSADSLQACFAAVPGDQTGRYVYFSLRYPSSKVQRHRPGRPLDDVNRVVLTFDGQKETRLTLAYQVPPLARSRYPSQLLRFDEVHELAGFASNEGGQPSRLLSGQAFERQVKEDGNASRNFVTMVGRLDVALLLPQGVDEAWPSRTLKGVKIGVRVFDLPNPQQEPEVLFDIPPGTEGRPLVSLTQAYLAAVPSRATLQVTTAASAKSQTVLWRSDDAEFAQSPTRLDGRWQEVADKFSEIFFAEPALEGRFVSTKQSIRIGGTTTATATLTSTPYTFPDIAARALIWISGALVLIVLLSVDWGFYIWKLSKIRSRAYAMAVDRFADRSLGPFGGRSETGTLARVLNVLLRRIRSRDLLLARRQRAEHALRSEHLRLAEGQVQTRNAILDAIGHEIRSPLQSLLNSTKDEPIVQQKLTRIRRAVEALGAARSVEDGLRSGEIAASPHDLAAWLSTFAYNLNEDGKGVVYKGPESSVIVNIDSMRLEDILDNMIDNAQRHRVAGSDIELRLLVSDSDVSVHVYNRGPSIPEEDLERIFDLGVSNSASPGSSGLGLFASRVYGQAMEVTMHAENQDQGVAMVLRFPIYAPA
jgi:signal transduction histidine kinase